MVRLSDLRLEQQKAGAAFAAFCREGGGGLCNLRFDCLEAHGSLRNQRFECLAPARFRGHAIGNVRDSGSNLGKPRIDLAADIRGFHRQLMTDRPQNRVAYAPQRRPKLDAHARERSDDTPCGRTRAGTFAHQAAFGGEDRERARTS